jgi:hypothetical protein
MQVFPNRRCVRGTGAGNPFEQKSHSNHSFPASLRIAKTSGDGNEFDISNSPELAAFRRGQQPPW